MTDDKERRSPPDTTDRPPEEPPTDDGPTYPPEEYWRRFTTTFRREQLDQLEAILAQWSTQKRVRVSVAEVLRLALSMMIEHMEENPDDVILALYRQEQREERETESRKYGRSRGAERYLRDKGIL